MPYDSYLFCEIVESQAGVGFIRQEEFEGVRARLYQGITGKLVIIDISDEDIDDETGTNHLIKLGLADLIPALYPPKKSTQEVSEDNPDSQTGEEKCD